MADTDQVRDSRFQDVTQTLLVALDCDGRITKINEAACQLLGRSATELIGAVWFERCLAQPQGMSQEFPLFSQYVRDVSNSAESWRDVSWMGETIEDAAGLAHFLAWRVGKLIEDDGCVRGIVASGLDVTERRHLEDRLAQERFLMQALMNHVPDHIYFKDRESRIIRISQSMARTLGLSDPADLIGKTDFDFFADEHARQAFADEQEVIRSSKPITLEECETWPNQPDTWVSTTKVPLCDESGAIVGTFGISRDITARRQVEADVQEQIIELTILNRKLMDAQSQLLQSEKMASVGQLAAGVAHEINNPIGYISSNLHSLKTQVSDLLRVLAAYQQAEPALAGHADCLAAIAQAKAAADLEFLQDDVRNLIDESLDGVGRVKRIVDNLKDFSRIDTAEWHLADLESGLESTLNIVWNELKYKAEVRREYAGLPKIECIGSQLNQVFLNLLINAAQAIEERGQITVRTGFDERQVWVEVEDSGKGIKPEHLQKIFDPFFTTKPVGKGTGLGLSLAYGIVERHHGRFEVRSQLNEGTTFRVVLPRKRTADEKST